MYRRVLCRNRVNDDQLMVSSLQALAKVYKRYHEEIGGFSDMAYILQLLDRVWEHLRMFKKIINNSNYVLVFIALTTRRFNWTNQVFSFK